ncbi:MAG: hypothetical protein H5U03_02850 [Clostridia bacterium]|nr:hypothetical protein [Clostridia bacterium]
MRLQPGEKSILAYFPSIGKANQAIEQLKNNGFSNCQLERVSRYGTEFDPSMDNPISTQATNQTSLSLYSSDSGPLAGDDSRVLLGADPSVSGTGLTDYGLAGQEAYLVTVVSSEKRIEQARAIIEKCGGKL